MKSNPYTVFAVSQTMEMAWCGATKRVANTSGFILPV